MWGSRLGAPCGQSTEGRGLLTHPNGSRGWASSEALQAERGWWAERGPGTWSSRGVTCLSVRAVVGIWVLSVKPVPLCRQCLCKMLGEHRPGEAGGGGLLPSGVPSQPTAFCFPLRLLSACLTPVWWRLLGLGREEVVCSERGRRVVARKALGSRLGCRPTPTPSRDSFRSRPPGPSGPRAGRLLWAAVAGASR